ncbi:MAG: galactokinase family protein [Anaerolineae bacterium]|jgi:galactokinase/mevalonate kinase-like predicted kinase
MSSDERKVVCSAPGRAGIIGNPTDMYGGSVISCSVGMRARVTVTPTEGLVLATNGEECTIKNRDDLRPRKDLFDIPRAILDYARIFDTPPPNCRIEYVSEIPMSSGMSSSTALLVSILQAILAWRGEYPNLYQLAERARYIELNYLEVVCGYQDAYMCTFGGLNYMDFRGKQFYRSAEAELFATIEPLCDYAPELPFVLGFTGVQHASGAVHKPIRERWLEGESAAVKGYERITEIARMGKKALLTQDWPTMGHLMNENHAIQRELGGSGDSNERLIAAALEVGALGAKLAGAGSGGTIIALWPWEDATPLEEALRAAGASATYRLDIQPGAIVESPVVGETDE